MDEIKKLLSECNSAAELTHCLKGVGEESMKNGIYKIMDVSFDDGVSSGMKKGIAGGMAIVLGLGALAKLGGKAYRFFIKKKKEKKIDKEQVVYAIKKSMQEWKEENENCPEQ